jgi:hypothetical protein
MGVAGGPFSGGFGDGTRKGGASAERAETLGKKPNPRIRVERKQRRTASLFPRLGVDRITVMIFA